MFVKFINSFHTLCYTLSLNKLLILPKFYPYILLKFDSIKPLQEYLEVNPNKTIGFVPTMGALHKGHISLIKNAQLNCDIVVCSIFVNPKQFNKQQDLDNYPNTIERDLKNLEECNCDIVFVPSVLEIYPKNSTEKSYDFGSLATEMEGEHRPGHFDGVAQVIERFFQIINPDYAFFGEKDYQQLAIVRALTKQLNLKVKIIGCPTVREPSGLAMSSRNERLTEEEKKAASKIFKCLKYISENKEKYSVKEIKQYFINNIDNDPHLKTEYFEIADSITLKKIKDWKECGQPIAFTAVNVRDVRLIDNITINN